MLFSAFFFGLISSLHCVAMCGPIALMLPVDKTNPAKRVVQIMTYHLGRMTAYASLGVLFGLLGRGFFMAGFQQKLSIAVGIIMILIALVPERKFAQINFSKPVYKLLSKIKSTLGKQFNRKSFKALFIIGLLNGFLPCGMVYAALFGALAMPNFISSIGYMMLYGIGTIPLLVLVTQITQFTKINFQKIQKIIPVILVLIGVLFILRGAGMAIPYLSPNTMSLHVQQEANCH